MNYSAALNTWLLIWIGCLTALGAGCASVTTSRVSKPERIPGHCTLMVSDERAKHYCLRWKLAEAELEIGVLNAETEKSLLLVAVVPITTTNAPPSSHKPLLARLDIWPRRPGLTLDPKGICYVAANQAPVAPCQIEVWAQNSWWRSDRRLYEGMPKPLSLDKLYRLTCYLSYDVDANPDIRFSILTGGLSNAGESLPATTISFAPARVRDWQCETFIPPMIFAPN